MATIVRGSRDQIVEALRAALDDYETDFPGAEATLYRQNPGAVRVRIVDDRFVGMNRSDRHDHVMKFLRERAGDDPLCEVSLLLLLPHSELRTSLANLDFEDPTPPEF